MRPPSPNALGSLYMTIGSLGYVLNDGAVRRVTEDGPGVYQVLFLRSVALALLFAAIGHLQGRRPVRAHFRRPVLVRVVAETVASALFFAAVVRIEFATAQAILQVVPFLVTLAAAFVLRERVRPRRYLAIFTGLVGVLIVVRPATDAFSVWSLAVLASALFQVVRELATRNVDRATPASSIAFATASGLALLTGALSLSAGWQPFSRSSVAFFVLSVSSLTVGYVFSIETVRVGDLSVSAPFRYTIVVGAVAIGYLMFDEVPDVATIVGIGVVVASGLYALRLDRTIRSAIA